MPESLTGPDRPPLQEMQHGGFYFRDRKVLLNRWLVASADVESLSVHCCAMQEENDHDLKIKVRRVNTL